MCSYLKIGGEDLLLMYKLHAGVEQRVVIHKVEGAIVDIGELVVDVVELGTNIVAEVIIEMSDLHSVIQSKEEGIEPVPEY
jgi:hypothetical protein